MLLPNEWLSGNMWLLGGERALPPTRESYSHSGITCFLEHAGFGLMFVLGLLVGAYGAGSAEAVSSALQGGERVQIRGANTSSLRIVRRLRKERAA